MRWPRDIRGAWINASDVLVIVSWYDVRTQLRECQLFVASYANVGTVHMSGDVVCASIVDLLVGGNASNATGGMIMQV